MLTLFSRLVDSLPVGVVVLDAAGRAVLYNRIEEQLAGRRREDVIGSDFFVEHGFCMNVPHLAGQFREHIGRRPVQAEADLSFPFPFLATPREVRVNLSSFESAGAHYGLLVIRDVSHERSVALMRETLGEMIVHDLKNPLASVKANLGFLNSVVRDNQDARDAVLDSLDSVNRISGLLTNLLDSARLETNSFPLVCAPVDVRGIAAQALTLERAVARSREVHLSLVAADGPMVAEVDGELVLRIFENLIDNAVRKAKHITLGVRLVDDSVVLEVGDDGPGIPAEQRARVFEKYAQVESGAAHTRGLNRGLGLNFVQQAARAHGGDVEVDVSAAGGALFRVRLPKSAARPPVASR